MSQFKSLSELATEYIEWDPNEETRSIVKNNEADLENVLRNRLQFGTAGLRGPMGAGYNRMNDLVILQTTQGLVDFYEGTEETKSVIIGYDHRCLGTLSSKGFARMSAAVFLSKGWKVYLLENCVPTPFVAFGVTHLKCLLGLMVTASHNPKQDNGFKVYNSNGSQIIPPYDTLFAASIDKNLKPWQSYDTTGMESHPNTVDVTDTIADAYFSSIPSLCDSKSSNGESPINAVYTAMHGVGNQWVKRAFDVFGHKPLVSVPSQSEPDPTFPTVVFPNPEEKGALNESIKFAESTNSTLIIANDPDADRLAVAEMQGDGTWHTFSGNEIGVLLGYWQIQRWRKQQSQQEDANSPPSPAPALLASVVSSRMLKAVAKAEGCLYQDTLTGFKWLGDAAVALRKKGVPVIFSYEEALGYCLGDVVVDKDGVTAAAVFLEMATSLKKEDGRSVFDHLQFLYSKYGEFRSFNSYVISHDAAVTEKIFARLRTSNQQKTSSTDPSSGSGVQPKWKNYWSHCVGVEVRSIIDVTKGFDSTSPDGSSVLPLTPESHMIMFEFANGVSVTLRTSGTEPKIKWYSEIAGAPGVTREQLDQELHSFVGQLVEEMLQPQEHGLGRA